MATENTSSSRNGIALTAGLQRASGAVLAVAAFLTLPLAVMAPLGLAPLMAVAGLSALLLLLRSRAQAVIFGIPFTVPAIAVVALAGWALISIGWAIDPSSSFVKWTRLALTALAGLSLLGLARCLDAQNRRWVETALVAGVVLGLVLLVQDVLTEAWLRRALRGDMAHTAGVGLATLNRGATLAALLIWPACLVLVRRRRLAALLLLAAGAGSMALLESDSAHLAFVAGLVAALVVAAGPRVTTRMLAAATFLAVLAAPLAPTTVLAPERVAALAPGLASPAVHRLYIWRFTAKGIAERPWLGWGIEAARRFPGRDVPVTEVDPELPAEVYGAMTVMPLHPHNAALQVWLELGAPGALILAVLAAALVAAPVPSGDRWGIAIVRGTTVAAILVAAFSYGFWQSWWQGAMWLTATITVLVAARPSRDDQEPAG